MENEYKELLGKRLELAKLQRHASDNEAEQQAILAAASLGDEFALLAAWETEVRAQFIQARLDALPAVERPHPESVPTLAALLLERIVALKRKMLSPGGSAVLWHPQEKEAATVGEARRHFARSVTDAVAYQTRVKALPIPGDDATEEQVREYEAARADFFLALEQAFKDEHRLELALVWGDAWREWRKTYSAPRFFHAPPALMTGPGALSPYFGPKPGGEVGIKRSPHGKLTRLVVRNNRSQLELMRPGLLELEDPGDDALFGAISGVLTNRTWRMFMCCFAASQQDEEAGRAPKGSFLYTPTRHGGLMGLPRVGKQQRIEARYYPEMDREMDALSEVSFTATVNRGGTPYELRAEKLVFYAHATIKPKETGRAGRRPAEVWSFNSALLQLMDTTAGGYYCAIPISALAPPPGVDQRVWDGAFKLYTLLSAHARVNASGAHTEGSVPWARLLTGLLDMANITGPGIPDRKQRARGLALLEMLREAGLVRFELDGAEGLVRYDLPAERGELVKVPSSRQPRPKAKRTKGIPG